MDYPAIGHRGGPSLWSFTRPQMTPPQAAPRHQAVGHRARSLIKEEPSKPSCGESGSSRAIHPTIRFRQVVGAYKPLASNLVKFPLEIVSAEIKIDKTAPVVAFGQAVAYRLFSTKTYIAMPTTLTEEDQSRLEALCMLFGVGLVLFDLDPANPSFQIRVRAQRFSPDMFYVNEFADRLRTHNAAIFQQIFG
jgi:hypothetical protein